MQYGLGVMFLLEQAATLAWNTTCASRTALNLRPWRLPLQPSPGCWVRPASFPISVVVAGASNSDSEHCKILYIHAPEMKDLSM